MKRNRHPRGEAEKALGFNTVEYAVREMFKSKSVKTAAKFTAEQFNGTQNMFLSRDVVNIDVEELEEALWDRMVDKVLDGVSRMKAGMGHFALDGTIQFYRQTRFKKERAELKERVIDRLGNDPFENDVE